MLLCSVVFTAHVRNCFWTGIVAAGQSCALITWEDVHTLSCQRSPAKQSSFCHPVKPLHDPLLQLLVVEGEVLITGTVNVLPCTSACCQPSTGSAAQWEQSAESAGEDAMDLFFFCLSTVVTDRHILTSNISLLEGYPS